jgi:hypothetical protein
MSMLHPTVHPDIYLPYTSRHERCRRVFVLTVPYLRRYLGIRKVLSKPSGNTLHFPHHPWISPV